VHGWLMKARIAQEVKDNARLEQAYQNAVKADPNDYNALVSLSSFYLQDGVKKYDLAEKYARAAIKLDPARATAYSLLAAQMVYTRRFGGDLDTLLAQAEKANPDDLAPYFVAGRTLVVVGQDFDDAERYLHKYLSQEPEGKAPKHAYAHWRLGQLYQKSGKQEQARAEFQSCLRLEPSFEPAKKDLKALK
jgi:tetratricopeptide (TPR) repeat protein